MAFDDRVLTDTFSSTQLFINTVGLALLTSKILTDKMLVGAARAIYWMSALTILLQLGGCKGMGVHGPHKGNDDISILTDVAVNLPDRGQMTGEVANIIDLMNGVHLKVNHVDDCSQPSAIDKVTEYEDALAVNMSLKQGCSYDVTLALGQLPSGDSPKDLVKTYYANSEPHRIAASDIAGKAKIAAEITLKLPT